MAVATEIKSTMSEALKPKAHPYEMSEPEYVDSRVASEIRQYERAITSEKQYLDQIKDKARPKEKEKLEWKIQMWGKQLDRLKSGEWKRVNANYLHEQYAKMLKKAISTGQPVPQSVINQAPEYKAAQTARERYEKGWKTSFANRSVAINEQMKEELGYKVKRQDGKPITSGQLDEIAKGVGEVEDAVGPLHDLFDKSDITIVHTSGKHPFLSGVGGTYTSQEKAVNIGVAGVKALGHELGHWLDYESGKAENLASRVYSKAGKSQEITSTAESWQGRYKDQKPTELGQLIEEARYKINKMREVREYMKADYGKDKSAEEKEQIKLVREQLSPYWREPREIWARLVEQYIATKNGKAGLATDSPEHYEHRPGWWTKEDFAKMMPQVEALVKGRLRALRGSDVIPPRKRATAEKKLEEFADDVQQIEKTTPVKGVSKPEVMERRTLGGGNVSDIGSEDKPVLSPYGLQAYRKDGFWYYRGYSMSGSGELGDWMRVTDPQSQGQYDALYTDKESIVKAQAEAEKRTPEVKPKAEAPKPSTETKVEGITYYRGVSRHSGMEAPTGERRRPSIYLTKSEREAKFYGKDIEKVTVKPKNPMYSETAVDAAEKLGVIEQYDKFIGSDPIKADEVIYNAAKKAGYDAIIRRDGDWVQVIDKDIISLVGKAISTKSGPEAKEPWEMTLDEYIEPFRNKRGEINPQVAGGLRGNHRNAVSAAITQGKPVPAEVLKDYPELGKREEPKATSPKGKTAWEKYYIHKQTGWGGQEPTFDFEEVKGRKIDVPSYENYDLFLTGKSGSWEVSEGKTGYTLSVYGNTISEAIAKTKEKLDKIGGKAKLDTYIESAIKSHGLSPRYGGKPPEKPKPTKAKGKEGWQMTRSEWMDAHLAGKEVPWPAGVAGKPTGGIGMMADPHWMLVKRAVEAGKPVPAKVLEKYPDLAKLAKPEPKAESKLEAETKAMGLSKSQIAQARKEGVTTALGLRRIEKSTRREPKPRKEIGVLQTKPSVKQSDRAIAIDRALLAKQVVPVNDPRWLQRPNRFDVRGIDTPSSGRVTSRTGFTDRGKTRLSRRHHRGWKKVKLV